jgi:hypothetical protein
MSLAEVVSVPSMTAKEWSAAYQAIEAAERAEERRRLPQESIASSLRTYFALSEFLVRLTPDAQEAFAAERFRHYREMATRWQQIARRHGYDFPT